MKAPQKPLTSLACEDAAKSPICEPGSKTSPDTETAMPWSGLLSFQNLWLNHQPVSFVIAAEADRDTHLKMTPMDSVF